MTEKEEEKGFSVKDRRFFSESGEPRTSEEEEKKRGEEKARKEEKKSGETQQEPKAKKTEGAKKDFSYPEVTFSHFILSLHTSARFHFGDFQDPSSGEAEKNLEAAKQMIDILSMLKEKTSGNLTENEKHLLEGTLFELRMRFVKESGLT